jgi:TonB-dependent starch-binding outer membrane protein SusC
LPLPGVSIQEKGTSNWAQTDIDGNYSITVKSKKSVLVFMYQGFKTVENEIGENKTLDIQLVTDLISGKSCRADLLGFQAK